MTLLLKRTVAGLAVLVPGMLLSSPAQAGLTFNPNPLGPPGPILQVGGLDEAPGNALARGSVPLVVGGEFTLYYEAVVTAIEVDGSGNVVPPNMDTTANGSFAAGATVFEITVVAQIREVVTSITGASGSAGASATFALAPDQTGMFIRYYYDKAGGAPGALGPISSGSSANALNGQAANNTVGSGFAGGALIYEGRPDPNQPNTSNFTLVTQAPVTGPMFPGSGQTTVFGNGSTSLIANTVYANPLFFPGTTPGGLQFTTTQQTPYGNQIRPAANFSDGTGFPGTYTNVTPSLGAVNGLTGPDFEFLADGNTTFLVPEPSTLAAAFAGLLVVGLGVRRSRRQPTA